MRPPAPWTIREIDLADPASGAHPLERHDDRPVLMILRHRGAVLARAHLLPDDLPMTAAEVATFAAGVVAPAILELLRLGRADDRPRPRPDPQRPEALALGADCLARLDGVLAERRARPVTLSASIVICTRQRPHDLAACLAAIAPEIAAGREVIVVDNGPDAETRAAAEAAGVRYAVEPSPGVARARNRGTAMARGDVVVCIDDDVRPEPGWIEPLLRRFDAPDIGVVTGLVLPETLDTEAQVGFEYDLGFAGMSCLPLQFDRSFVDGWPTSPPLSNIGTGASMAIRREMLRRIGGFDERVGPGTAAGGHDDAELWHHALLNGYTIRYEPLSVVRHKHRETFSELKRQAHGYGKGHVVGLLVAHARTGGGRELRRLLVTVPRAYARRILRAPIRRLSGDPDRLLWSSLRGYLGAFRHVAMAFSAPIRGTVSREESRDGDRFE